MYDVKKLRGLYQRMEFEKIIQVDEARRNRQIKQDNEMLKILGITCDQQALREKNKTARRRLQKKAEYYFKQILKNKPNLPDAYRGLGLVALHQNKLKKSLRFYKKAYAANKKDIINYNSLANAYRAMGKYVTALRWYKKSLLSKDKNIRLATLVNIAVMLDNQGKTALARPYVTMALHGIQKTPPNKWMKNFELKLGKISAPRK